MPGTGLPRARLGHEPRTTVNLGTAFTARAVVIRVLISGHGVAWTDQWRTCRMARQWHELPCLDTRFADGPLHVRGPGRRSLVGTVSAAIRQAGLSADGQRPCLRRQQLAWRPRVLQARPGARPAWKLANQ